MTGVNFLDAAPAGVSGPGRAVGGLGAARPVAVVRVAALCVAIVAVGAFDAARRVVACLRDTAAVVQALATEEARLRGLAPAASRVRALDDRRANLADRLRRTARWPVRRAGPIVLLTRLREALPSGVWLVEIRQEPAATIVRGRAEAWAGVLAFVASLERAEDMVSTVELVDTSVVPGPGGREVVRFELRASAVRQTSGGLTGPCPGSVRRRA